ncbi:ABC transporter permease subunit [Miniimonas arenae]|uniref:ABC transporter permease subunit n=1 Tax=Miniimonas arenae TaxID=676201 RepID=A0A5C5BGQ1_9MICO|nr:MULTISPECIES: ABC transporter permease subunit [Miniimonas]TNU76970.1 ABC transporter permease subunit [Miniimonas arenae]
MSTELAPPGSPPSPGTTTTGGTPDGAASPPRPARPSGGAVRSVLTGLAGAVVLVGVWWLVAAVVLTGVGPGEAAPIPTPPEVVAGWASDGWSFYARNFSVTLQEAAIGFLWGNGLALAAAALVLVAPRLEGAVMQLATLTYCIPIVAIGGLVVIILGAPPSGQPSPTAIFLAALSVFFTTVVGSLLGLKAADQAALDVVTVYGGSRFTQLVKVRVIAALPHILTALQIAVPAAFLGAILGEYFGKVDLGIGPAMINAQNTLDAARLWGLALASGAVAMVGYLLFGLVQRFVAPWSRGRAA